VSEAEVAYRKALDADAKNADTNAALGHALALQGRSVEAAAAYRKALALAPGPPLRRALIEELRGDLGGPKARALGPSRCPAAPAAASVAG
jgi:Flp pilus assembly protein TadD